ncbi:glycosyltransferase family 32 protein [Atractiella rhizophila]|nr:glycosyltransferase family 32 protein [Atractiella rhizophila]
MQRVRRCMRTGRYRRTDSSRHTSTIHSSSLPPRQPGITHIKPDRVFFWTMNPPKKGENWWWDRVLEERWIGESGKEAKVEVRRVVDVTSIWGRPVEHWAHKADIVRLEALLHYGGIYLDLDVFVLRPFSPLYHLPVVMGIEAQPDPSLVEPSGLCNAIILAQPWAPFISRWYQSYRTFDKGLWAAHSVSKPYELALKNPYEVAVLDKRAFFWPLWHDEHLDLVHKSLSYDFKRSKQFAYHLWESTSYSPHLEVLDPDRIHVWGLESGESSFTKKARDLIKNPLRERWREDRKRGLV